MEKSYLEIMFDDEFRSACEYQDDIIDENARLKTRIAELEAELAKDVRAVFDSRGKSINLMRI